jgi:hypothetical protein
VLAGKLWICWGKAHTEKSALRGYASLNSTILPPIGGPHEGRQRVFHLTANGVRKGKFLKSPDRLVFFA